MDENGLGEFIRKRRKERGMSMRALARAAEVSPSYMSQIEQGARTWPRKFIPGIARALQVSEEQLAVAAGIISSDETPSEEGGVGRITLSPTRPDYPGTMVTPTDEQMKEWIVNSPPEGIASMLVMLSGIDLWLREHPGEIEFAPISDKSPDELRDEMERLASRFNLQFEFIRGDDGALSVEVKGAINPFPEDWPREQKPDEEQDTNFGTETAPRD